jgi:hypothetical protein
MATTRSEQYKRMEGSANYGNDEAMHLHRTAVTCLAGASRTLTAAEQQFRPAPQYLPQQTNNQKIHTHAFSLPHGVCACLSRSFL